MKCQKPQSIREKQTPSLNLSAVEYETPVSLSHVPLKGGVLLLDKQGFIHVVDNEGRLLKLDSSGAIVHSLEAKDLLKSDSMKKMAHISIEICAKKRKLRAQENFNFLRC